MKPSLKQKIKRFYALLAGCERLEKCRLWLVDLVAHAPSPADKRTIRKCISDADETIRDADRSIRALLRDRDVVDWIYSPRPKKNQAKQK